MRLVLSLESLSYKWQFSNLSVAIALSLFLSQIATIEIVLRSYVP